MSDVFSNDQLMLVMNQQGQYIDELQSAVSNLGDQVGQIQPNITTVVPQAVNEIYNGSITHSVKSWFNDGSVDDEQYECFNFYSHPSTDGQAMYKNTTKTSPISIAFVAGDVTTGSPGSINITDTGLGTGTAIMFTSTGGLPGGLSGAVVYYAITSGGILQIALTPVDAVNGVAIALTTTGGGAMTVVFNYTLKNPQHTLYSADFCDWSWTAPSAGCARFQGSTTIDAIVPGGNIDPGYTYFAMADFVKLNAYVTIASEERLYAGLYAKQGMVWDWIGAPFVLTATVLGTVATPTSRDYRILTKTDRGFTVRSDVLTVTGAPSDADFGTGARVYLQWKTVLVYGVQTYEVYRKTGSTYELIQIVTTGLTSTLDTGAVLAAEVGWPTADFDRLIAYVATIPNIIDKLPYINDPLNPSWASIPFTLKVPQNYDKSTTDMSLGQWLRFGFSSVTGNLDLSLPNCVTTIGSPTVTSTNGVAEFRADQVGLTIEIRVGDIVQTSTVAGYTSSTIITMTDNALIALDGTDGTVYITGGAPDHSVFFDLVHLTYVQGAAFSPAAADIDPSHGIPPVLPNGTSQGGAGQGQPSGSGDGHPVCLFEDEGVEMHDGTIKKAVELKKFDKLVGKNGAVRTITEVKWGLGDVWLIQTANNVTLKTTATKQVFLGDDTKTTVGELKQGDILWTKIDDVIGQSPVVLKEFLLAKQLVIQISLSPHEDFWAGTNGSILVSNVKAVQVGPGVLLVGSLES